jgi:hypothetical protein
MDLIDLFLLAVAFYAAYKAGQISVLLPIASRLREEVEAGRISLDDDEDLDEECVNIERHPEGFFAYGSNNRFLAQGTTFEELFTQFKHRFPNQSFRVLKNPDFTDAEREQMKATIYKLFGEEQTA